MKKSVHDRLHSKTILIPFLLILLIPFHLMAQELKTGPKIETTNPMEIETDSPKPDWAPEIDPQMHVIIEQLKAFENPKPTGMTAFQFRNAKLPTEAVMKVLKKNGN